MNAIPPNAQRAVDSNQPELGSPAFYARQQQRVDTLDTANRENADRPAAEGCTFTCFVNHLIPVLKGIFECLSTCVSYLFKAAQRLFQGQTRETTEPELRDPAGEPNTTPPIAAPAEDPADILAPISTGTQRPARPYQLLANEFDTWKNLSKNFPFPCALTAVVKIVTQAREKPIYCILQEQYTNNLPSCFDLDVQGLRDQIYPYVSGSNALENLEIDLIAVYGESPETCRYFYQASRFKGDGFNKWSFTETSKKSVHSLVTTSTAFESAGYDNSKVFYRPEATE